MSLEPRTGWRPFIHVTNKAYIVTQWTLLIHTLEIKAFANALSGDDPRQVIIHPGPKFYFHRYSDDDFRGIIPVEKSRMLILDRFSVF
ncbi:hypothetical protein E4U14_000296 [Claviceps sp. LM454 group G7]|nr:hypothetical protein E4U14_000296 [Claviceps sp. LM454 group G7]